jgi:hypothetical protein
MEERWFCAVVVEIEHDDRIEEVTTLANITAVGGRESRSGFRRLTNEDMAKWHRA